MKLFSLLFVVPLLASACGTLERSSTSQQASLDGTAKNPAPIGGYQDIATNDPDLIKAADFAVAVINKHSNSLYPYRLEKILSAKFQIVSGTNYAMTLQLVREQVREIHEVIVYSQPWTQTMQLTQDKIVQ